MSAPDPAVITTVIPTYRRPRLLRRAIQSVLAQTYSHVRVCVYDNASGDDTEAVVREMMRRDSRVKYHRHPRNLGPYGNFNYGMQRVETPYFSLLSDDDLLLPDFYRQALECFDGHPQAMFVSKPTIVMDLEGNVISPPVPVKQMRYYSAGEGFEGMVRVSIPNTWTGMLFRRQVKDRIGLVDLAAGPFADGGYVWLAAARFPFVASPGIAAVLMSHGDSTSGRTNAISPEWAGWWERMIKRIEADPQVPPAVRRDIRRIITPDFRKTGYLQAMRALLDGKTQQALDISSALARLSGPRAAMLLRAIIGVYRRVPGMQGVLRMVKSVRDLSLRRERRHLQQENGSVISLVKKLEQ